MSEEIKCKFYSDNVCRKKYKRDCLTCINNEYDSLYRLNYENQVKAEENYKRLEQKYNEVLKLAKDNADSNEYCLQEDEEIIEKLQKENEELKEKVKRLDKMTGIFSARLCEKYRHALEEIRNDLGNGFNNARRAEDLNALIGIAIDKINKVLESEEK